MSKLRGRPFERGNKTGRGRPKGSRNKPRWPGQAVIDEFAPHLIRKCIALAMQGDRTALRLCIERIIPARQDALIHLSLPATVAANDVDKAAQKLMRDVGRGRVTPGEGGKVMSILEGRCRIIEKVQVESRIEALERKAGSEDERRTG